MSNNDQPVFFDKTGQRWRKVQFGCTAFVFVMAIGLALFIPAVSRPVPLPAGRAAADEGAPSVPALETAFNAESVPVLGQGQFIRAVRVEHRATSTVISDVFGGNTLHQLSPDEVLATQGNTYALERYGQLPDRQLVLTFDDGPDATYTPQLLNLLSKNHVPAAFFMIGANVVKQPKLAQRAAREGHVVANHTFSHIDFEFDGTIQGQQEINQTGHVLTAATGQRSAFIRVPYAGNTDESQRDNIKGILEAQRLGYVPVSFDYDTDDWKFTTDVAPNPRALDGHGKIVLLHDSGGDRSHTVRYVATFIPMAQRAGYTFVGLDQVYPGPPLQTPVPLALSDRAAMTASRAVLVWPSTFLYALFSVSVLITVGITLTNITLACLGRRRARYPAAAPRSYRPMVSVLIPAYNEAAVIEQSVLSVLRSKYRNVEIVIIDDGSHDNTRSVGQSLAAAHTQVRLLTQKNSGKAAALTNGLRHSSGQVVICMDADTVFTPRTISQLVRHFYNPQVGGVAGYVRVGNRCNLLTRWQALEYITSIALERAAQAFLGAITVVPGACGAWRRVALEAAGGFSDRTLAEDCDIALAVHQAGYTITQDTTAISYTECPLGLGDLAKQRFRWTFGNIQSYWQHRRMFFNRHFGWLGCFMLPNAALSLLLPLLFWPLLFMVTLANVLAGRWWAVILFPAVIMLFQFMVAAIGLLLAGENLRHLVAVPFTRLVYGPLRTYILYRSLLTVLRGALVGWDKLGRTKTVSVPERAPPFPAVRPAAEE